MSVMVSPLKSPKPTTCELARSEPSTVALVMLLLLISYAVFCLKKKKTLRIQNAGGRPMHSRASLLSSVVVFTTLSRPGVWQLLFVAVGGWVERPGGGAAGHYVGHGIAIEGGPADTRRWGAGGAGRGVFGGVVFV